MNDINLSQYKIVWVEFFPFYGYVTQHDQKQLGAIETFSKRKTYRECFQNKDVALNFLRSFSKKLDKSYRCLISTDKQFGMAKEENKYEIQYTDKQKKEVFYLFKSPVGDIMRDIKDEIGFCNLKQCSKKEVVEWVKANYECSIKTARQVADVIMYRHG